MPLAAVTHEKYLDKIVEKLTQLVNEMQLLRKDTEAMRRLLNEIAETKAGK